MDQRTQFIADHLRDTLSITELCELYGVSCKTGYKWIDRYPIEGGSMQNDRSVLVVAATPDTAVTIETALERARLAVDVVSSGEDAIAALKRTRFRVMIVDPDLPGIGAPRRTGDARPAARRDRGLVTRYGRWIVMLGTSGSRPDRSAAWLACGEALGCTDAGPVWRVDRVVEAPAATRFTAGTGSGRRASRWPGRRR